ncbi:MAG: serine/threonine protein kinase [Symploca sp. SIO2G7]|nr:serine/threonine protein kinase [Symploca sp. SIO2G7]
MRDMGRGRSLRVHPDFIIELREVIDRNKYQNQQKFADKAGVKREIVSNFLTGKPVDKWLFAKICKELKRDPQEIADLEDLSNSSDSHQDSDEEAGDTASPGNFEAEYPEGSLPLDSPFYIERPPIETSCYAAIIQAGALLRIKASQKMGKTLLLEQVLNYSRKQGYQTVKLDLRLAEKNILADYQTFLQSLCLEVAETLELDAKLNHYWRELYGLNKNCTRYWQKYLLPTIGTPVVLALDNFERLFAYPELFENFCCLLRGWYELGKQGSKVGQIWQRMRLVVVYSTEVYPKLDTNYSPFNVGVPIDLPELKKEQVAALAQHHKLETELSEAGLQELMELVGGHPYLLEQAFSALSHQNLSLEQLLRLAPTEEGIYRTHLHQQLWQLQHHPRLETGYKKVVMASEPVPLNAEEGFKLHSLGLVKLSRNHYFPSCNLYRRYFSARLSSTL